MVSPWIPILHVVGAILWVAGLTAVLSLLAVHPRVEAASREAVVRIGRRVALVMDLGATLTIAVGLYRALTVTPTEFARGGWLHIKLTAVVVGILSVHGIARVKLKKARQGQPATVAPVVWILLVAGVATAVVFGIDKGLMRG